MSEPIQQDEAYQQMAQLLNYDSGTGDSAEETAHPEELELLHHPEDEPTKRRFSQKGTTKLLFVTGGVLISALIVGAIANQIFRPQPLLQSEDTGDAYEEQDDLTLSLEDELTSETEDEISSLKTEVALQDQAQQLRELETEMTDLGITEPEAEEVPETVASEAVSAPPTPRQAAAAPPRPASAAAPPPQFSPPTAPPPAQSAAVPAVAHSVIPESTDLWDQWNQLAHSGTLGQVQTVAFTPPNGSPSASRTPVTRRPQAGTVIGPARTVSPGSSARQPVTRVQPSQNAAPTASSPAFSPQPSTSQIAQSPASPASVPGLRAPTSVTVPIGATATATVTTPVLWPGEGTSIPNSRDPNTPKYIVTTDEPLTSTDGETVVPANSQLIVTVAPLDATSGIATLDVLAVVRDEQPYPVPPGQLQIRGADGNPLVASRFNDPGGDIFAMDVGLFAISGLANLGAILNRPRSSTVITSEFQGTIANEFNDPNYLGAVLEGGAGALADRLSDRNERAIEELAQRPTTWYLPAGTRVQLFVNQPMRM